MTPHVMTQDLQPAPLNLVDNTATILQRQSHEEQFLTLRLQVFTWITIAKQSGNDLEHQWFSEYTFFILQYQVINLPTLLIPFSDYCS